MTYEKLDGSYTEQEKLELDIDNLSNARLKLNRQLNHFAKEWYLQEVERLEKSIKNRTEQIIIT